MPELVRGHPQQGMDEEAQARRIHRHQQQQCERRRHDAGTQDIRFLNDRRRRRLDIRRRSRSRIRSRLLFRRARWNPDPAARRALQWTHANRFG
jgi:hypothetical protein